MAIFLDFPDRVCLAPDHHYVALQWLSREVRKGNAKMWHACSQVCRHKTVGIVNDSERSVALIKYGWNLL
ncbi:MAG: hypothetical protein ABF636_01040 [Acetobacter sp.]